jgi:hypothetical protein
MIRVALALVFAYVAVGYVFDSPPLLPGEQLKEYKEIVMPQQVVTIHP